jgi:flagellar biosynthesis/type III secretory pathway protein FliH
MSFSNEPVVAARPAATTAPAPEPRTNTRAETRVLDLPELDRKAVVRTSHPNPSEGDVEARVEAAQAAAHQNGFDEGRRAEEVRVGTAIEAVRALVTQLERADERRREEVSERIAVLATAIASHLVEREVRASPDVMSDLVRRAVAEFPLNDPLRVHLNPSDLALLSSGLADDTGREQLTSGQAVRWIPDPAIRSGGCLVEGSEQVVDARLSRTLERICRALVNA